MDVKTFLTSFTAIFLAELGDKTQLANLGLVARTKSPILVYTASALAYLVVSLLTISLGGYLSKFLPEQAVKTDSGVLFVLVGVFLLLGKG